MSEYICILKIFMVVFIIIIFNLFYTFYTFYILVYYIKYISMKILGPIIKSKSDRRRYSAIELSNKLTCLIISDS